ncbi:hypothetical protein [Xylanimonas protaetiae]|uniref:Uncharacterized protein n=1 Tax=Xylanimonas protaetiae TaxID=2509457 RepID=A0A4P6F1K3_9MICO|nr:hypothetical protein [Xylanimonas protaetiae]QAY69372.1 hypothetical protein ET471_04375 [Xylanimonas protaetiae]
MMPAPLAPGRRLSFDFSRHERGAAPSSRQDGVPRNGAEHGAALREAEGEDGTMETVTGRAVTRDEVRAAIHWALDHDVRVLAQHRQVAHTANEPQRRRSDADLVARWRRAVPQERAPLTA